MPLSDLLATKKEQPDVSRLVDAGELYPAKSVSAERYHSIRHKTVRRWLRETLRVSEQEAERYAEGLRAVGVHIVDDFARVSDSTMWYDVPINQRIEFASWQAFIDGRVKLIRVRRSPKSARARALPAPAPLVRARVFPPSRPSFRYRLSLSLARSRRFARAQALEARSPDPPRLLMPAPETRAIEHAVRWRVARVRVGLGQRGLTGVEVAHRVVDARRDRGGGGGRTYDFVVGHVGAHCAEVCELALRKHEHIKAVELTHVAHVPADRPIALSLVTTRGRVLTACALEFRHRPASTRVTRLCPPPPRALPARGARERKGRREEHVVVGLRVECASAVARARRGAGTKLRPPSSPSSSHKVRERGARARRARVRAAHRRAAALAEGARARARGRAVGRGRARRGRARAPHARG